MTVEMETILGTTSGKVVRLSSRRRAVVDVDPWRLTRSAPVASRCAPPGFRFEHDGVSFEAVKAVPHDGARYLNVWLVTWRTRCVDCDAEVTTMSTAKGWQSLHRKRCQTCRSAARTAVAIAAVEPMPLPGMIILAAAADSGCM